MIRQSGSRWLATARLGGYHEFPDYGIIELIPVEGRTDRWEIAGTPLHFIAANGQVLPLPDTVVKNLVGLREVQVAQLAPGRFEFRLVPITGSDLAAAQEQAPENVDKYFGPRQTVTLKIMDHILREPSGKLKSSHPSHQPMTSGLRLVVTCGARRTRRS